MSHNLRPGAKGSRSTPTSWNPSLLASSIRGNWFLPAPIDTNMGRWSFFVIWPVPGLHVYSGKLLLIFGKNKVNQKRYYTDDECGKYCCPERVNGPVFHNTSNYEKNQPVDYKCEQSQREYVERQ